MSSRGYTVTKAIKERRRKFAKELEVERAKRSPSDQLKVLDQKLGAGNGAKKERARLQDIINEKDNVKKVN